MFSATNAYQATYVPTSRIIYKSETYDKSSLKTGHYLTESVNTADESQNNRRSLPGNVYVKPSVILGIYETDSHSFRMGIYSHL